MIRLELLRSRTSVDAVRWANDHPKESAQILSTYLKISPEEIESVPRAIFDDQPRMSPSLVQPVTEAAVKYGALGHSMPAANLIW